MTRKGWLPALAVWVMAAGSAQAQSGAGGAASFIVSATTIEGGSSLGMTGAVGYRFNRTVGVSMEITAVPSFDPELPPSPTPVPLGRISGPAGSVGWTSGPVGSVGGIIIPSPTHGFGDKEGRATIFTTNLRLEIPTESRRLLPYLIGGAGVAHIKEEFTVTTVYPPNMLSGFPGTTLYVPRFSADVARSSTDMAVTMGGGIGVLVTGHLSLDVDLRYLAILGSRDRQTGRFGGGISYRF